MSLLAATRALRARYQRLWLGEHARRTLSLPAEAAARRRLAVHEALVEQAAAAPRADRSLLRREALPAEAFRRDFLATDTPVVLSGAASAWPCCQRWTPAFFAERYGDETVRLLQVAPGQRPVPGAGRDARFDEIAASTEAGGPLYARFSGLLHRHPELVADLDLSWLRARRGADRGENWGFFLGGAGTATGLHSSIAPNLFVQVAGRKRWTILPAAAAPFLSPTVARAPYFTSALDLHDPQAPPWTAALPGWSGVLEPGDVLWVPAFAWHQVENLGPTVAVGYRWMSPRLGLRTSLTQTLIAATSTNPPPWRAKGHKDLPTLLDAIEY